MWQRFKNSLRNFMVGRNGADELATLMLFTSLILMIAASFTGLFALSILSWIGYGYCLFRTFSKNVTKRREENYKFVAFRVNLAQKISQFFTRLKNTKKYKYFKCPQCRSRLRLPRKVGNVTVTCGKCKHKFEQKA